MPDTLAQMALLIDQLMARVAELERGQAPNQALDTTSTPTVAGLNVGTASGAGTGVISQGLTDAGTNNFPTGLFLTHRTSGVPATNFGVEIDFLADSSTNALRNIGSIIAAWGAATDASRKGRVLFYAYDTAIRECIRIEASGAAPMLGFYSHVAVVQPAAPVTLADVIAVIRGCGLSA